MTNKQCSLCGNKIYRTPSQQKQSKSGLYFCSKLCKNVWQGVDQLLPLPSNSPLFKAVSAVYAMKRDKEYLTGLSVHNVEGYEEQLGEVFVIARARINGKGELGSKTPADMESIRGCFDGVKLKDIVALEGVESGWKSVSFRYWNKNDITYEIE